MGAIDLAIQLRQLRAENAELAKMNAELRNALQICVGYIERAALDGAPLAERYRSGVKVLERVADVVRGDRG